MNIITRQSKIDSVSRRWKEVYFDSSARFQKGQWRLLERSYTKSEEIYNQLLTAKTKEEVDKVIGNSSWTKNECAECNLDFEKLISFSGYEETIEICLDCLYKAVRLLYVEGDPQCL